MSSPDEGPSIQLPDPLVRSVARQAERIALAVASFLNNSGHFPARADGPRSSLPRGFLLHLAAIFQLGLWERQGFRVHIDQGLPSYSGCAADLRERVEQEDSQDWDVGSDSLYRRVLKIHSERFSWEAEEILGEPVAIYDGDQFVDEVARFLWEHRDTLDIVLGEQVR